MFKLRSIRHMAFWMGALALAVPGARAQSGVFSLNADYTGYAHMVGFSIASLRYYASGDNPHTPSGLTSVGMYVDVNRDPQTGSHTILYPGFLTLDAPGGAHLYAIFSGQGTFESYGGTFAVTGGTGRYNGSTGGGTFQVHASPSGTPATISIRGTATGTPAAIPEPGSLALLGLAGVPLLWRRCRRSGGMRAGR